jgi:hypothetical protein
MRQDELEIENDRELARQNIERQYGDYIFPRNIRPPKAKPKPPQKIVNVCENCNTSWCCDACLQHKEFEE